MDPVSEEAVEVGILFHLLLPLRPLELLVHLHQILKVVKREDPAALVDDKEGQEVESHINVGGQPDPPPGRTQRDVLHDVEAVLQLDIVGVLDHLVADLVLEVQIGGDGFGVEDDGVVGGEAVVGCGVEVGLAVVQEREPDLGRAHLLVPREGLEHLGVVGEGDVVLEEVDFGDDGHEDLDGDIQLCVHLHRHLLLLLVHLVVHSDVLVLLVQDVAGLIEKLVVVGHKFILAVDAVGECFGEVGQLLVRVGQGQFALVLLAELVGLVQLVLPVQSLHRLTHLLALLLLMGETWHRLK